MLLDLLFPHPTPVFAHTRSKLLELALFTLCIEIAAQEVTNPPHYATRRAEHLEIYIYIYIIYLQIYICQYHVQRRVVEQFPRQ